MRLPIISELPRTVSELSQLISAYWSNYHFWSLFKFFVHRRTHEL